MPAKSSKAESDGFSAEERAAMKERAAELRAEGKKGAKQADGLQTVLDRIAQMAPEDRALAARACDCDRDRPRVVAEDLVRHARLGERGRQGRRLLPGLGQVQLPVLDPGIQDAANLDDGDMWAVSYALLKWSALMEEKVVELVKSAISRP